MGAAYLHGFFAARLQPSVSFLAPTYVRWIETAIELMVLFALVRFSGGDEKAAPAEPPGAQQP